MTYTRKKILLYLVYGILAIVGIYYSASKTLAAELIITQDTPTIIGVGQSFTVNLEIQPSQENINAIQTSIFFQNDDLQLQKVSDGDSIITLWIQEPHIPVTCTTTCETDIRGIIVGGFKGIIKPNESQTYPGTIAQFTFIAKREGVTTIAIKNSNILLNDGKGTPVQSIVTKPLIIDIQKNQGTPTQIKKNNIPPESFVPQVGNNKNIFNNEWFVAFATQDKQSGINHYEIMEKKDWGLFNFLFPNTWTIAQSPYRLEDQSLQSYIYVKAIDNDGNITNEVVSPQNKTPWYRESGWEVVIIIFIGIILFSIWKMKKKE